MCFTPALLIDKIAPGWLKLSCRLQQPQGFQTWEDSPAEAEAAAHRRSILQAARKSGEQMRVRAVFSFSRAIIASRQMPDRDSKS